MALRSLLLVCVLATCTGCGANATVEDVDALAADADRLRALVEQCHASPVRIDVAVCRAVDEANRRRFFAGLGDADEYQTLADLPVIASTFDGPVEEERTP